MNGDTQHPLGSGRLHKARQDIRQAHDHGADEPQVTGITNITRLILANADLGIAYTDLLVVCSALVQNAGGDSGRVTQPDLDAVAALIKDPEAAAATEVAKLRDDLDAARHAGHLQGLQRALKRADEAIRTEIEQRGKV